MRVVVLQLLLSFVFSKALVWSVLNLSSSLLSTVADSFSLQPIRFAHTLLAFTPTFKLQFFYYNILSSNMHSYETLALLALAVSTASPALSAPVQYASCSSTLGTTLADNPLRESQQQARAIVDERATAAPGGVGSILKTIGTGLGLGALPVVLQDALGGNGTRRDLPARIIFDGLPVPDTSTDTTPANIVFDGLPVPLTQRAQVRSIITSLVNSVKSSDSLGKVLTNGVIGGVGSGVGAVGVNELLNNTR